MVAIVASSRSIVSSAPVQPKSCALALEGC
jgi:hypothetical protein